MSSHQLIGKVRAVIARVLEVEEDDIPETKPLDEVFDIDSLDLVDVVVGIERHFKIRLPKEESSHIRTLAQAAERVEVALARKAASAGAGA